jgi:ribosomal protein S21
LAEVIVYNGKIEEAIALLKKLMVKDGILKEVKKRQAFESRPEQRKRKRMEARRRLRKLLRRQQKPRPGAFRISPVK